jgi:hypothetical protein
MFKIFLFAILFIGFTTILNFATADEDQQLEAGESSATRTTLPEAAMTAEPEAEKVSIMDIPVNFSTPEDIEKTFQLIKEEAGEGRLSVLRSALSYILTYDLGLGHDEEKMYKKMNGRTPNQIISKTNP